MLAVSSRTASHSLLPLLSLGLLLASAARQAHGAASYGRSAVHDADDEAPRPKRPPYAAAAAAGRDDEDRLSFDQYREISAMWPEMHGIAADDEQSVVSHSRHVRASENTETGENVSDNHGNNDDHDNDNNDGADSKQESESEENRDDHEDELLAREGDLILQKLKYAFAHMGHRAITSAIHDKDNTLHLYSVGRIITPRLADLSSRWLRVLYQVAQANRAE